LSVLQQRTLGESGLVAAANNATGRSIENSRRPAVKS
jgi:hypothetical protein